MTIFDEQSSQESTEVDKQARPMTPEEQMAKIREETIERLYLNDPLISEGIQAQLAVEAARPTQPKTSNILYDENGNVIGTKTSPMSGGNAADLMKAIRESYNKTKGEES